MIAIETHLSDKNKSWSGFLEKINRDLGIKKEKSNINQRNKHEATTTMPHTTDYMVQQMHRAHYGRHVRCLSAQHSEDSRWHRAGIKKQHNPFFLVNLFRIGVSRTIRADLHLLLNRTSHSDYSWTMQNTPHYEALTRVLKIGGCIIKKTGVVGCHVGAQHSHIHGT